MERFNQNKVQKKPESTPLSDQYFTTMEVAQILKVHEESVRRWIRNRKLRAVKLGGKFIRVSRVDLDTFINQQTTEVPG